MADGRRRKDLSSDEESDSEDEDGKRKALGKKKRISKTDQSRGKSSKQLAESEKRGFKDKRRTSDGSTSDEEDINRRRGKKASKDDGTAKHRKGKKTSGDDEEDGADRKLKSKKRGKADSTPEDGSGSSRRERSRKRPDYAGRSGGKGKTFDQPRRRRMKAGDGLSPADEFSMRRKFEDRRDATGSGVERDGSLSDGSRGGRGRRRRRGDGDGSGRGRSRRGRGGSADGRWGRHGRSSSGGRYGGGRYGQRGKSGDRFGHGGRVSIIYSLHACDACEIRVLSQLTRMLR